MKKLAFLLMTIGAMVTSCDPMQDIYDEQDSVAKPIVGNDQYTLTDDDYETLDLESNMFASEDQAKELLPDFIADMYPYWGQGSSVLIDYNLAPAGIDGVGELMSASNYTLSKDDYAASGSEGAGFYPNEDPTDYLPGILAEQYPDAVAGQVALLQYKQYTEVPEVGVSNLVDADFKTAQTLLDWTAVSVTGDQVWEGTQYGATMNGYDGSANVNEDWLISPEIDLAGQTDPLFQVTQILNYANDTSWYSILISKDYDGENVSAATWDTIEVSPAPEGNSWSAVTSDDFNLEAYEGETIHVAFKYESDATSAATWEIEQVLIKVIGVEGMTVDLSSYYQLNEEGAWEMIDNAYYLSSADYDSMGTASGLPGRYDNFSSTALPENYLPRFLANKYPYAQEEEEIAVTYKYYNGSATVVEGNIYTFTNGVWVGYQASLQFGYDNGTWVPDNTIKYALVRSDYDYMAAQLESEPGYEAAASSMGNYGNLDRREGNSAYWSDDTTQNNAGITDMIQTAMAILLTQKDPGAAEGQKYLLTYDIYNGTNTTENISMIKTDGVWLRNN